MTAKRTQSVYWDQGTIKSPPFACLPGTFYLGRGEFDGLVAGVLDIFQTTRQALQVEPRARNQTSGPTEPRRICVGTWVYLVIDIQPRGDRLISLIAL